MSKIPQNVTYILQPEKTFLCGNGMYERYDRTSGTEFQGRKAFVTDSTSTNSIDTGISWAKGWGSPRDYVPEQFERPNDPMTDFRIFNVEIRDEGGRAWKVVNSEGFIFDLREDQLLYVILTHGIQPNGVLPGSFVWGYNHTQMRLIAVGSPLHQEILEAIEEKQNRKKFKVGDLVVGGIYKDLNGSYIMYRGRVRDGKTKKFLWTELQYGWSLRKNPWEDSQEHAERLFQKNKNRGKVTGSLSHLREYVMTYDNHEAPSHETMLYVEGAFSGRIETLTFE